MANKMREKNKLPSGNLTPVRQIEILGERVTVPAPSLDNGLAAEHTPRSIEIEKAAREVARRVFEHKMPIEKNRLNTR